MIMDRYFFNRGRKLFSNPTIWLLMASMVLLLPAVWAITACGRQEAETPPQSASSPPVPALAATGPQTVADFSTAIERVAVQSIPAVAHIEVTERQEVVNPLIPFAEDPFFRRFFGVPELPRKFERELKGLGTGIVIDAEGHILTNYHVAGGATKIEVLLANGNRYPATLVGADRKTDLAVIRISADDALPYLSFADSDQTRVGQWVVAIGHPRGLDQTVTQGIISAKHRTGITDPSSYQDFLQTDAAINPGNSGGPLLNLQGEVVGVNAAIVSQSGGFEGIGFAIPANMARHVVKQLLAHGKVERGWLGVDIQDLEPDLAESFGLKSAKGALIAEVIKGGPADKAGLRRGDIVLAFNGKEIDNASSLRNAVAISSIGQQAKVTVFRDGKKTDMEVVIGNLTEATKLLTASIKARLGCEVRSVTSKEAGQYGLNPPQGVVITWLDPNGPLGRAGFTEDDILLEINNQPIEDVESLVSLLDALRPRQKIVVRGIDHRTGSPGVAQLQVR
jgi:serine protease Do